MFTTTAKSLLNCDQGFLSFGCIVLDEIIGGIPISGITEVCSFLVNNTMILNEPFCFKISGEAGSGKTQICLTLALQVKVCKLLKCLPRSVS